MEAPAIIVLQKFCDAWKAALIGVLQVLGTDVACDWSTPLADALVPAATSDENAFATRFQISKDLQGAAVWLCQKSVAVQFAQLLQSEPLDPAAEFSELQRDAFAEFLRQVAGQVASEWKAATSNEIELNIVDPAEPPTLPGTQVSTLELKSEKFSSLTLQLFLDPPLCAALIALPAPMEEA